MKRTRFFARLALMLATVALVSGCKLAMIVVEGGSVESSTGTRDCAEGQICLYNITDTTFDEVFTARPKSGWRFTRWNSGGDFFCADTTTTTCVLSNVAFAGNAFVDAIIATDKTFYAQPVFETIPDKVTIPGAGTWYQPDLFTGLTWDQITSVCPAGSTCPPGSTLAGQDMTGCSLGFVFDVNNLFNFFAGPGTLLGPSSFGEANSEWADEIFFWFRPIGSSSAVRTINGWTATLEVNDNARLGTTLDTIGIGVDEVSTINGLNRGASFSTVGAWFSCTP